MVDGWNRPILRLLRVPPEPSLPAGTDVSVFRAAPAYYRYRLVLWGFVEVLLVASLVAALFGIRAAIGGVEDARGDVALEIAGVLLTVLVVAQVPASLAILNLDFEMRWYIVSDRSLRIREGVLQLREKTMTFANIQNIEVRRNPLQRLLGIADVRVRTAGGGGSAGGSDSAGKVGESMHEATFRGVDEAELIRSAISARVRAQRGAGLGDPDEAVGSQGVFDPRLTAAAVRLRQETSALRGALRELLARP